ncbi:hypothetical protein FB45DRAFT_796732 [Roridomyces roridus]|uniref:NAD(P)-binding protein n=1 Tax=Roridomyces roridus TaxID=1738132 RepID=A0AAD7FKV2_9AGAR|nr:hypothetical protein FB45DRAFT_796732 [Roridomyces roridus]
MFSPRTIFVTGANQGLGMHAVHQLAATPDVLVFMGSRKLASAEEALAKFASDIHSSSTVIPVQLDITDATSIQNAHDVVAKTLKEKNLSALDVLVNNAAIAAGAPEAIYATNVLGVARLKDAFLHLIPKGGSILNVSSGLGSNTLFTKRPAVLPPTYLYYSSSKAALNSLTVQWALDEEQKASGIRVISICPGLNATNLNNYMEAGGSPADGCKVIVKEALTKDGKTAIFVHKDGEYPW